MLEFELYDRPFVECFNKGRRGNQWDLWSSLPEREGQTALYVDDEKMPETVSSRFKKVEPVIAPLVLGEKRRPIKEWYVYKCFGFMGPGQE